ncbi:acyl-CoA dehydrogenase [Actinoplanes sp. NPDC023936]|uniref:acyl-CoA dehydrogenase family protein n=1 Tax=Actinoplanes sp. NPDC023936 TaxID=3154910 RepID=UPI0033E0BBE0
MAEPATLVRPAGHDAVLSCGRAGVFARCLRGEVRQPLDTARLRAELPAVTTGLPTGAALSVVVHVATFLPMMWRFARPDWPEVVDDATHGRSVGAIAATDAGAPGTDLTAMTTRLEITGGDVVLDGAKTWVTNGLTADHLIVLARHRPGRHFGAFTAVLVPADTPGVSRAPAPTDLMAGAGLATVRFREVRLEKRHILGGVGRGLAAFLEHIAGERFAGGVWSAALGRELITGTVEHLRKRSIDDRPLWERSSARHALARLDVRLRMLDALVERVAATGERDRLPAGDTMAVKAAVGELLPELAEHCLHARGADGLTAGSGIRALADDLRAFAIAGGSTETMLDMIATELARP